MLFLHNPLCLVFAFCIIIISHGASIKEELQITIPQFSSVNDVSLMNDIDQLNRSLFVRQHIQIENEIRHIYIAPLALFDINQIKLILNPSINRTTMIIPLILYTDEQMKFIRENNTSQCEQSTTKCLYHQVSIETMRVIYKHEHDPTAPVEPYLPYIYSTWLSYNSLLNQRLLYINIDCTSHERCLKLSKKPMDLYLQYAIQQPEQHQVSITGKHLLKINTHSSKLLLERDVDQFLKELLAVAGVSNNSEYVLSQIDLFLLKETLKKQLFGRILILTDDNDEKLWNSIYWANNYPTRPDRIFKLLKKKVNSKYSPNKKVNYSTDVNSEMDDYVRQIYDKQSFQLYFLFRDLFELHRINDIQGELSLSLKLKPILTYELNKFNRSNFLIHQTIHKTKRDYIHSIPIRSIMPLKQTQSVSQRFMEAFQKLIKDCIATKSQLPTTSTTTESTQIEHIETNSDESADSAEVPFTSTSDSDATSITPSISTTTEMIQTTTQSSTTISSANTSVTIRYGSAHGGSGGDSFDDEIDLNLTPMKPCIGVEVFWRTHLFAIRFIYEQDDSSLSKVYYGHDGNPRNAKDLSNETFLLTNEERISKVTLYAGIETGGIMWKVGNRIIRYILGIQFHTTTGRTTRLYGVNDGQQYIESFDGFTLGYAKAKSGLLVDMLQFVWYNYGPFGKTHDGVWVEAANGKVPPDAVVGGQEDNRRVYVVRFKTQKGNMIPGKLVESSKIAEGPYFGVRTSSVYQVLTNPDPKRTFKWITTSASNIPDGAFVAGKEKDTTLYVARVSHDSESILIGKYHAAHGAIYFTHEGREKRLDKNFEVLCVS